tara:strand:+ start:3778 stop:4767 length:990 start_codon:yes stop_codon:yes gene_type:complete
MPRERKTRTSTEVLHYLITLSETNRADELPNEWNFIVRWHRNSKDNNCLCRQLIKNQNYYYNWKTKKVICLGDSCQYTYGFKERRIKNDEWREYYLDAFKFLTSGEDNVWLDSFDLEDYCKKNYALIMEHIISSLPQDQIGFALMEYKDMITEVWGIRLGINLTPVYDTIQERLDEIKLREEEEDRRWKKVQEQQRLLEERIKQEALELLEIEQYETERIEKKEALEQKKFKEKYELRMEKIRTKETLKEFIKKHIKLYEKEKLINSPEYKEKLLLKFIYNHLREYAWKQRLEIMKNLPPCDNFNFCKNKSLASNVLGNGTKWCDACFI